jgi:hypothetical protein
MRLQEYYYSKVKYPLPSYLTNVNSEKTIVYLIYNEITKLYKIGITSNIKKRHRDIENAIGCKTIIKTWIELLDEGDESPELVEKLLFEYYSHKRKIGEWFQLNCKDETDIKELFEKIYGSHIYQNL